MDFKKNTQTFCDNIWKYLANNNRQKGEINREMIGFCKQKKNKESNGRSQIFIWSSFDGKSI